MSQSEPIPSEEERAILDEAVERVNAQATGDAYDAEDRRSARGIIEASGLPHDLAVARAERDKARDDLAALVRSAQSLGGHIDEIRRIVAVEDERDALRTRVAALAAELDEIRSDLRTVYRGGGPMCEALRRTYLPRIDALLAESTTPTTESEHGR